MAVTTKKKLKLDLPKLDDMETIERDIIKGEAKIVDKIDPKLQLKIIRQVQEEHAAAFPFNQAKRSINLLRLKLYNNQRRNAESVGDPLMFTVFNTVFAALYDDRLSADWEGRAGDGGDDDIESNLNALSDFDYDKMSKNQIDYAWDWDTCFFGRGLVLMMEFERKKEFMCPAPENIDASTWIRDPHATSVNGIGIRGKGAMRYGGREVGATYYELKNLPGYFNLSALKKGKTKDSLLDRTREAHQDAQGLENYSDRAELLGKHNNYEFKLLDWFTTIKGDKYLVTLGNEMKTIHRLIKLDFNDRWPILDRALYPMANDWEGVSIPDLTEDKQRAKAVLINLGLISAKSDATPNYVYNKKKIKNKNDLDFAVNKFIGVDGPTNDAMQPVQKATAHQYVNIIMDILDTAAQRATATPEIQQGAVSSTQRTLGELELVSSKVDTRYAMSAKVFGWSEKEFWRLWYVLYKKHFKAEIDEKIIRIQGVNSGIWRPLRRENIIATVDPDVQIESKTISEAKKARESQTMRAFVELSVIEPSSDRRFILRDFAKQNNMNKEKVDMAFPPTYDELLAEEENKLLNDGKLPEISIYDDHMAHMRIHAKADDNPQTRAHNKQHMKLMRVKRSRPDLFPPVADPVFSLNRKLAQAQSQEQPGGGSPGGGTPRANIPGAAPGQAPEGQAPPAQEPQPVAQ